MIEIKAKKDCSGCHACANICPQRCIEMKSDEEGFLYPIVNKDVCINCGLCENVCPVINQNEPRKPLKVYAAKNKNEEVRMQSSSGGVFTLMAENVIKEGGVVFGAKFNDNWDVVHAWTDNIEGIAVFRGSKYVQSTIGNTYQEAKQFLEQGRKVLFSGTPCQIAGLNKYLRKEYDNLLTVDIVCHGVPSPLVWHDYLKYLNKEKRTISYVNLRDKKRGWREYSYVIKANDQVLYDDFACNSVFSKGFSLKLVLRPSCYNCLSKNGCSNSDITIADCWGIQKVGHIEDDNKGYSSILLWDDNKNVSFLEKMSLYVMDYDFIINNNPSIVSSSKRPYIRKLFWNLYEKEGIKAVEIVLKKLKENFLFRLYNKLRTLMEI